MAHSSSEVQESVLSPSGTSTTSVAPLHNESTTELQTALGTVNVEYRYFTVIDQQPYFTLAAAQQIAAALGLVVHITELDRVVERGGETTYISYHYRAEAYRGNSLVAMGYGSANSAEVRFAYRWLPTSDRISDEDLALSKARRTRGGAQVRVPNPDILALEHAISMTAQYRAYRAAINFAAGAERLGIDQDLRSYIETDADKPLSRAQSPTRTPSVARVATGKWSQAAQLVVAATADYYRTKSGQIDYHHLLAAARKLGYETIDEHNVVQVTQALIDYAKKEGS